MLKRTQIILSVLCCLASLARPADTFAPRAPRYHLHPGDVISVIYRYTPEYNATISVQPDGFATLPLVGELQLGGLTIDESVGLVKAKASERLNNPDITVDLKDFQKPYYIVGGQVGQPGKFDYRGPITALSAVQLAGGFKDTGKSSQVLLIRPISSTQGETKLLNLKNVTEKRQLNEDIELQPGDVLVVPRTWLAKVEPYVKLINPALFVNPTGF